VVKESSIIDIYSDMNVELTDLIENLLSVYVHLSGIGSTNVSISSSRGA
jgi:hypothetical protein